MTTRTRIRLGPGELARRRLAIDDDGYVKTDPVTRETSVRGIYAAGDPTSRCRCDRRRGGGCSLFRSSTRS
jgi:thioredoxin reductase